MRKPEVRKERERESRFENLQADYTEFEKMLFCNNLENIKSHIDQLETNHDFNSNLM